MINRIRTRLELWLILEEAFQDYYYESGSKMKMKISTVVDLLFTDSKINGAEFRYYNRVIYKHRPRELYLKKTIQKQILKIIRNEQDN